MTVTITPSSPRGTVSAPPSKSQMQRACAAALIRGGKTFLSNPGTSADDLAALRIIKQLGADVEENDQGLVISSEGIHPRGREIDCGESGLSLRMFSFLAAISDLEFTITGKGSLLKRPIKVFDTLFPQLGVSCKTSNGFLPARVKGPLQPKDIRIDGSLSSQFLTGLLMAYAAADASDVTVEVDNLQSKPYIDLTLQVLEDFGLKTPLNKNYQSFYFPRQSIAVFDSSQLQYSIEGDWSGTAFLLVAGAIAGDVCVTGLNLFSRQADRAILQALMQAEAFVSMEENQVSVRKNKLRAFQFDARDCPDLFPPLVALAGNCVGTSVIEGVGRLEHKESNRAQTLLEEFCKLGVKINIQDDLMIIEGGALEGGQELDSHGDHRIAMACAVAALSARQETTIKGAGVVEKSYPSFWEHLENLNVALSLKHNF